MADVGATAAAEHVKVRMAAKQLSVLIRQLQGIAVVELLCFVELSVTGAGSVCPQEAETLDRRWVSIECVSEVVRVCAVDNAVQRSPTRCGVDRDNRIVKRLTGWEPAIGLDGERDDDLDAGRSSSLHYPYRLAGMGCRQQRDSIGAGGNERVDLLTVVTRSFLRSEELGGVVTIAAWPDVAADDDLDVDIVTQCRGPAHRRRSRVGRPSQSSLARSASPTRRRYRLP
ncbi:hypothetical protein BH24ACT5_BH24ACT5_30010 [soil metagenome]